MSLESTKDSLVASLAHSPPSKVSINIITYVREILVVGALIHKRSLDSVVVGAGFFGVQAVPRFVLLLRSHPVVPVGLRPLVLEFLLPQFPAQEPP